jgi:cellulose synthase/poly-beta-1,6-N-acetylglucosamine synthase-like glycosyltransferase
MTGGIIVLLFDILVLLAVAIYPLYRRGDEDHGDGFASVLLPKPKSTKLRRVLIFYAMVLGVAIGVVGLRTDLTNWYGNLVSGLVNLVTNKPNLTRENHASVLALVPVLAALDVVCFGLMMRASIARRIMVMLNSLLIVALAVSVDAFLLVVWHASGSEVGPRSLVGVISHIAIGTLVMVRMIMASFQLPRPTAVKCERRRWSSDGFFALVAIVAALAFVIGAEALMHLLAPKSITPLATYVAYPLTWMAIFVFLFIVAGRGPLPPVPDFKIPIDVIIPAFNEIVGIHLTLRSIDAAAVRYGGPVRVILADDGSTDGTGDRARAEMAAFRGATGIVVPGQHLGKSAALNTALSYAETRVVVRIDADIVIDDGAFLTLPAWFSDPTIGSVGTMTYPRQDSITWFHRMRLFECLMSYGFTRQAQGRVDAIQCIPGTFTAFLREPTLAIGGFVKGINGEDSDLTMQLGRMGYRIVVDPRLVVYEDVPPTMATFREQRVRWNRAGTHMAARHSPFTGGFAGPRLWLSFVRQLTMRLTAIARPCVLTYLVAIAIITPGDRAIALTLFGFYFVASGPVLIAMSALAIRHKFARRIPWLATWWGFTIIRRAFVVDSLFTLPYKPVRIPHYLRLRPALPDADAATTHVIH